MMAIFTNKAKDGSFTINFFVDGGTFPNTPKDCGIAVTMKGDHLHFRDRTPGRRAEVTLPYGKIVGVEEVARAKTVVKDKSVLGRAIVGGLAMGPLGAVIGGMDGAGKEEKVENRRYYVISYRTDAGHGERIRLEIVGATLGLKKFDALLREKASLAPSPEPKKPERPSVPESIAL